MGYLAKPDDYKLVDLVKQNRHLYDKSHSDYRDRAKNEMTWNTFATVLGVSEEALRKRFRNLRDRFTKEKRHRKDMKNDPTLPLIFKKMLFLWDHLQHRQQRYSSKLPDESSSSKPEVEYDPTNEDSLSRDSDLQEDSSDETLAGEQNKRRRTSDGSKRTSHPSKKLKLNEDHFLTIERSMKEAGIETNNSSVGGESSSNIPCNEAYCAVVRDYLDQIDNPVRLSLLRIQILTILHNMLYSQK